MCRNMFVVALLLVILGSVTDSAQAGVAGSKYAAFDMFACSGTVSFCASGKVESTLPCFPATSFSETNLIFSSTFSVNGPGMYSGSGLSIFFGTVFVFIKVEGAAALILGIRSGPAVCGGD